MPTLTNFRTTGDDFANTIHTSGAVAVGDSSTGIIDTSGDVDWFRVTLQGGQAYTVNLRGAPSGGGTLGDPLIPGVYDADGNALSGTDNDDSAASRDSQVTFTVETDGTYFLAAGAYGSNAGTYTLELAAGEGEGAGNAGDDFSDNVRTLGTVAAGGSATGTIEQDGDADWFRVMLQAGQAYTISLRGAVSSAGTLADPMIGGVYDAEGQLIVDTTNDDTSGRDSQVVLTPTTSGAYYIAAGAYGSYTGTYTLGVMANTDDYTATTATTGLVEVDGSATGSIESARDIDWFRVTLQGGRIYRILQEGAPNGNGSLPDTHIRGIYRATGQLIANTANDDAMGTQNSEVQFRAPGTGTAVYYIAVGAYGQGIGTYKVTVEPVTTSTDGDIADDISTAGRVTVGDSVSGSVDLPEDADWYRVTLAAGQSYQVSLRGAATGDGTLSDPQIAGIHDVEGQLIEGTINDDAGGSRNAEVIFTPSEDGTYFIAARGYWYETGSYTLEVKPTEAETGHADTVSATTATTGVITVGRAQTSTIEEAGDIDWFRVSLSRGTTYTVTLNGAAGTGSALADPFFRGVHDAGGNMLADTANDDGASSSRDSRVTFTAPANGTYFLAAGAYGGGTGGYQLNITRRAAPTDDYANTVAAGGRYGQLTVGRSTTGTIGAAADIDLFGVTLQAGRTYAINLEGAATGQGTLDNPAIQAIYNAAGRSVRARTNVDTDGSANETLMFLPIQTGTYYIGAASAGTGVGTYQLAVDEARPDTPEARGDWTIMVYVNGDNDLEEFAISDVNEMEAVRLPNGVKVVVMVDRHEAYDSSNGNWSNTRRGLIQSDSSTGTISSPLTAVGEKDMGARQTLTGFINWGTSTYRASNYGLVVWDHGGGLSGTSWDEQSNNHLSVHDISAAISGSTARRLDFVGFDTCLQGMVEQSLDLQGQASVVVGSEELEPGDGWNYTGWLNRLKQNPTASPRELAAAAVESYAQHYGPTSTDDEPPTLSATDTTTYAALGQRLNAFVTATASATSADWQKMAEAREAAPMFGKMNDHRDLYAFMTAVAQKVSTQGIIDAARAVAAAVQQTVIANYTSAPNRHGLSIFLPPPGASLGQYTVTQYPYLNTVNWRTFLTRFASGARSSTRSGDTGPSRTTSTVETLRSGLATVPLGAGTERLAAATAGSTTAGSRPLGLLAAVNAA